MNHFSHYSAYANWLAARFAKQFGFAGLLGIGLILGTIVFIAVKYLPTKHSLALSQSALVQAQANIDTQPIVSKVSVKNPTNELSDLYTSFPNRSHLSVALKMIEQTAEKNKLFLIRGDYKFTLNSNQKSGTNNLVRYEIQVPITGTYTQVRKFVDEIMQQLPTLALTDLQFKRENIATSTIDARLVFTYFLKEGA